MWKTPAAALILLFLTAFLTGCARQVMVPVDRALVEPIEIPQLEGDTWRDLAESYIERGAALEACNERLEAIGSLGQ